MLLFTAKMIFSGKKDNCDEKLTDFLKDAKKFKINGKKYCKITNLFFLRYFLKSLDFKTVKLILRSKEHDAFFLQN